LVFYSKPNPTQLTIQHKPKQASQQTWEKGKIKNILGDGKYGFIEPDNRDYKKDIFVHIRHFVNTKSFPNIGERVRFYVITTEKGLEAREVCVQVQHHF
jgi:cold shock CspA family protein